MARLIVLMRMTSMVQAAMRARTRRVPRQLMVWLLAVAQSLMSMSLRDSRLRMARKITLTSMRPMPPIWTC
ncbi:hypothetical protein GGI08_007614, partial [Coemansia sp. S2]